MTGVHRTAGGSGSSYDPIEYKDAPLRFTFVIDGREEPVKIVEPKIDLPFPDGALLRVEEEDRLLCEVTFRLEREANQPYQLELRMPAEPGAWETRRLFYGESLAPESEMTAVYYKTILNLGNVLVRIEMTLRKARLQIEYGPGPRLPPQDVF